MTQSTTSPNPRMTAAKHLSLLTLVTFLVYVPFFSPRLVFIHDTLDNFIFFHYTYSEIYCQGEFPRWVPLLGYGMPFDFHIFDALQPTHYVAMAFGWLFRITDALLLFKLSLFLSQVVFVLGLFVLSKRLFTSMLTVWAVCLGALLTNSWLHNCLINFTIFYLLPLVLYLVLESFDTAKPGFLWAAGVVEALSLVGTLSYIAPLHLLILSTFVLTYCCREPSRAWLLVRWRTFVHPLMFVFVGLLVLLTYLVFGMEMDILAPGRDAQTGNVKFEEFLNFYRQPLAGMLVTMVLGHLTNGDMTNYVGFLPLLMLGYGLMRRRDTPFLALLAVAFVLLWFALGGYFTVTCYYCFPLMNKFRQISYTFNVLKVFVLLLGGLGFDQWLRDVRGMASGERRVMSGVWRVIGVLLVCFAADLVYSVRPNDLTDCWLNSCDKTFAQGPWTRYFLMARYLSYAGVLGVILLWRVAKKDGILLVFSRHSPLATHHSLLGLMSAALFAVYVVDVGLFYLAMVKYTRFASGTVALGDAFDVCPLSYGEQRILFDAKAPPPGRAQDIINILRDVSGKFPPANSTLYSSLYLLFRVDPIEPTYRIDLVMPGIKHMIESAGGSLSASYGKPGFCLPNNDRFKQSLGFGMPKIRIVREAEFVRNEQEACAKLRMDPTLLGASAAGLGSSPLADGPLLAVLALIDGRAENSQTRLIIVDEHRAGTRVDKPDRRISDEIHVTKFAANRVEIDVAAGVQGWLFDADAFDRGWKATVDGQPADVFCANVGCKAVHLQAGPQRVVFYFDRGLRDWACRGVMFLAAFFGFVLIGGVAILGLSERGGWTGDEIEDVSGEGSLAAQMLALRIWSACAITISLGCAFWLVPDMIH